MASAEVGSVLSGGGVWWGVSRFQPTRGSGGASWAPSAGSGAEPRPKTDFGVFWRPQNAHFCTYMTKSAGDNLHYRPPTPNSGGGTCPPVPPWSTPMHRTKKSIFGCALENASVCVNVWQQSFMAILAGVTSSESDKVRHSALASESLTNNHP